MHIIGTSTLEEEDIKATISLRTVAVTAGLTLALWGCGGGEPETQKSYEEASHHHKDHAGHHPHERATGTDNPQEEVTGGNTTCPVMGGKVNRDLYVDYEGKRIYLCCEACIGKVKQNPERYLRKLEELGEEPGRLPQAHPQEGS
jgi:YHS domain-containing protein